jgi:hypothetical protein
MVEIIEAGMQFIVGWQQGRVRKDRPHEDGSILLISDKSVPHVS